MAIPNPNPVVIPPVTEEKTYPHLWITNMRVRSPSLTSGSFMLEICPYNGETGEILNTDSKRIFFDLWDAVRDVPEAAQAMQAVFNSVPHILAWLERPNEPEAVVESPEPDGEELEETPEDPEENLEDPE